MYANATPEDDTSVIKMVKGFYRFLEKTPPKRKDSFDFSLPPRAKLFEDCFSKDASSSAFDMSSSKSVSSISEHGKSNNQRALESMREAKAANKRKSLLTLSVDEKAELIASKCKAAKLEVQLKAVDSERRRSDFKDDERRKLMADKVAKDQEEMEILRKKYKDLVEQKQTAVDELATFDKTHNEMKADLNGKIDNLQRENLHLKNTLEELRCDVNTEYDELKERFKKTNTEFMLCKQKLEETETQLNLRRSSFVEAKEMVSDYNELKSRCLLAEGKVKELEQKLLEQEQAYMVVQKSQSQLANYQELEKENKRLREDNLLFSESASNNLILEERLSALNPKVAEADELKEKVEELEYENKALLNKLKKWECTDETGSNIKARSPSDLTRIIGDLQVSQLNLTASNTQWETRARLTDSLIEAKQEECTNLLKEFRDVTAQNEQLEDKNRKLQRRLTLLTTERDGLRHVLSSYEQEEGTAREIHMRQAEEKVSQYHQQIKVLEDDLAAAKMDAVSHKTKYLELNQEYEKLKVNQQTSAENIKTLVEDNKFKKEYEELKQKYEQLSEEKEILQLRIEKNEMQGGYDPLRLKVLVMKDNPFQRAHDEYYKKIKDTFEENERMRKKIIKLQSANEELEESMNVSRLIKDSKPMENAMKQVQEWELKYKRLEEEYGKTAKRYRFAIKNMLGYSVKELRANNFRVQSIFSDNPDDFFIFECSQTKGRTNTGVIETTFTKQWLEQLEKYVAGHDSIPLFLAAVNQKLFSRTVCSI